MNTPSYALQEAQYLLKAKIGEQSVMNKEIIEIVGEEESTGLDGNLFGSGIQKNCSKSGDEEPQQEAELSETNAFKKQTLISKSKRGRKPKSYYAQNCPKDLNLSDHLKSQKMEDEPSPVSPLSKNELISLKDKILQEFSHKIKETFSSQMKNFTTTTDRYTDPSFVARLQSCLDYEESPSTSYINQPLQVDSKPKKILFFHKKITRTALRTVKPSRSDDSNDDLQRLQAARYRYIDPKISRLIEQIYDAVHSTRSLRRQTAVVGVTPIIIKKTPAHILMVSSLKKNFASRRMVSMSQH